MFSCTSPPKIRSRCPMSRLAVTEGIPSQCEPRPAGKPCIPQPWAGSLPCAERLRSASSAAGGPSRSLFHTILLFWIRPQAPPELLQFTGLREGSFPLHSKAQAASMRG